MLCDKCKKNQATYHRKTTINGVTTEEHLCTKCAMESNPRAFDFGGFDDFGHLGFMDLFEPFSEPELDFIDPIDVFENNQSDRGLIGEAVKSINVGAKNFEKNASKVDTKLQNLERELKSAVESEDYEKAAKLKKEIDAYKQDTTTKDNKKDKKDKNDKNNKKGADDHE